MPEFTNTDRQKRQTRIWIGPPYRPDTDPRHYDWTALHASLYYFTNPPLGVLSAALTDSSTTVPFNMTTGLFANAGGVWIQPTSNSQGWEYIEYEGNTGSSLTGLTRQNIGEMEHNGNHAQNSPLHFWYPLTALPPYVDPTATAEVHVTQRLENQASIKDWSAQLTGFNFPRHAIRNNHLCVIEERYHGDSGPGAYAIARIGWLQNPSGTDTSQRQASWTAEVVSISAMINRFQVAGVDVGERDVAKDGSASSSTVLTHDYKERESGDFTEADPTFDAANILDREPPLWISEQYVGTYNYMAVTNEYHRNQGRHLENRVCISVIYLQRPLGLASKGYRFIELTVVPWAAVTAVRDMYLKVESSGTNYLLDIGEEDVSEGNKIILCEDQNLWQEENPLNGAQQIHEIPTWVFDSISPTADSIVLQSRNWPYSFTHGVSWGLTGEFFPNWPVSQTTGDKWVWQGSTQLGPIPAGQALRYVFAGAAGNGSETDPSAYWDLSRVVSPGYTIGEYGTDENRWNAEKIWEPWIQVDLPGMQLRLRDDITDSDPPNGGTLYIVDAGDIPSTQGLDDTGHIYIGQELLQYVAKTMDSVTLHGTAGRGALGTTAIAHQAGDTIRILDTETNLATTAPRVNQISWTRPEDAIYPAIFKLYTSVVGDGRKRHPGDESWEEDWTLRMNETNYAGGQAQAGQPHTWIHVLAGGPKRVESYLFVITGMSEDPYRPRLNESHADLDPTIYDDATWLNAGESVGQVIQDILQRIGVPDNAITLNAGTLAPTGYTVETGYAWATAADLADYANAQIEVTALSEVVIGPSTFWTATILSADHTWGRPDIKQFSITQRPITPIKQLEITYYTPSTTEDTTAAYPTGDAVPDDGEIQSIGRQVFASAVDAAQAAERRYNYTRYPYTAIVELANPIAPAQPQAEPGEIVSLSWEFGPDEHPTNRYNRLHVIESVDIFIDGDAEPAVTVALTQIERSSYE